ncbi:hypothetical protein V493_06071 [Pseudogymnoascus sp. VKM F-4281 (FW-2241)]|nr:hypothetical protein V493_06071 [Pseudogymnoascus sp. VKM F-4281 (FW-2241)]
MLIDFERPMPLDDESDKSEQLEQWEQIEHPEQPQEAAGSESQALPARFKYVPVDTFLVGTAASFSETAS